MSLDRHIRVLWRFRAVTIGGLALGLVLAFLAAFQVNLDGGVSLERRGTETWTSSSRILVTQRGFPWGRVTLPAAIDPNQAVAPASPPTQDRQQYADPTRFVNLAMLYSVISYSDQVRTRLPGNMAAGQIEALPLDATGGGDILPIITLNTTSDTAQHALELNQATFEGLKDLLLEEQVKADIPVRDRVVLEPVNKASAPLLVSGRSPTASALALILALALTLSLAHLLEALRLARIRRQAALDAEYAAMANGHFDPLAVEVTAPVTASPDR